MAVSYDAFIQYVKANSGKQFTSDEEAYNYGRTTMPKIYVTGVPTNTTHSFPKDQKTARELHNQSPTFFDKLDWGVDENSYDWVKSAYVNSLTGMMEDWMSGDPSRRLQFDAAEYEENKTLAEDIGSSILGFLMPADIAAMYGGGKLGGMAINVEKSRCRFY